MHFPHTMQHTCVEEDALRRRGLAGIDMRHDADVSGSI
jgi:hypothetical protein